MAQAAGYSVFQLFLDGSAILQSMFMGRSGQIRLLTLQFPLPIGPGQLDRLGFLLKGIHDRPHE